MLWWVQNTAASACNVRNSFYYDDIREAVSRQAGFIFLSRRGLSGQAKFQNHLISPFIIHYGGAEAISS
jgi:hypothetical protein